jgi:peptidoglycan/xylan/chitin deacetylase (PgdA/CDA1 family)
MTAHGVMFHHFFDSFHPNGQGAISGGELDGLLKYVGRDRILPAHEWMRRALAGTLKDDDLCLTFDDALLCQYDIAFPVLNQFGLTAFWFVYSSVFEGNWESLEVYRYFRTTAFRSVDEFYQDFFQSIADVYPAEYQAAFAEFNPDSYLAEFSIYSVEDRLFRYFRDQILGACRYEGLMQSMMSEKGFDPLNVTGRLWMNDDHLRALRRAGHLIGLHSYTHPTRLADQPVEVQAHEYERNFEHLARVLGEDPVAMSHPCNSYNELTLPILERLGIRLGFRANMQHIVRPSRFEFPRRDHAIIMKELRS